MSRCLLAGVACSLLVFSGGLNAVEPLQSGPPVGAVNKTPRRLGAYVMFMNDAPGLDVGLRTLAQKEKIQQVALGIVVPPPAYAIAAEADVTVVVYPPSRRGGQKVSANFALRKGELDDAKADEIVKAIAAVLPAEVTQCTPGYMEFLISEEARKTLRPGSNVLAVTCRDTGGGRTIDVGLVETKR